MAPQAEFFFTYTHFPHNSNLQSSAQKTRPQSLTMIPLHFLLPDHVRLFSGPCTPFWWIMYILLYMWHGGSHVCLRLVGWHSWFILDLPQHWSQAVRCLRARAVRFFCPGNSESGQWSVVSGKSPVLLSLVAVDRARETIYWDFIKSQQRQQQQKQNPKTSRRWWCVLLFLIDAVCPACLT